MTKEKYKEYYKKNKEKIKEKHKEYNEKNKEKVRERKKKWSEKNKDKMNEYRKKYNEDNCEFVSLCNTISRYFRREFYRYISLENYLTIQKLEDLSLKRSIMIKLGHGNILEYEAVALSGMVFTEEDKKQLFDCLKNKKSRKRSPSKY